METELVSVAL